MYNNMNFLDIVNILAYAAQIYNIEQSDNSNTQLDEIER